MALPPVWITSSMLPCTRNSRNRRNTRKTRFLILDKFFHYPPARLLPAPASEAPPHQRQRQGGGQHPGSEQAIGDPIQHDQAIRERQHQAPLAHEGVAEGRPRVAGPRSAPWIPMLVAL